MLLVAEVLGWLSILLMSIVATLWTRLNVYIVVSADDIALIVQTGFHVKDRLAAQLETVLRLRDANNTLIAADYEDLVARIPVVDVISGLAQDPLIAGSAKFQRYLEKADSSTIESIAPGTKNIGWTIGAYKFLPAWNLASLRFPRAKWFLGIDDDTFIFWENLYLVLSLLDHRHPYYIGNIASYGHDTIEFMHGGSGILASKAVVRQVFEEIDISHWNAMVNNICCGDVVLGMVFNEHGIQPHGDLQYLFNSKNIQEFRVSARNMCLPPISLHGMTPNDTRWLHAATDKTPKTWLDFFLTLQQSSQLDQWDFVHIDDKAKKTLLYAPELLPNAARCERVCENSQSCLAWTFDQESSDCWLSPSFAVGRRRNATSGLMKSRISQIHAACRNSALHTLIQGSR